MEDILIYVAIGFTSIIMVVIAMVLISLGSLIDATPDGRERRGELIRDEAIKNSILAPKNISRVFAVAFIILFLIGCLIVVLGGSKVILIIGGVTMFSALLFSSTIAIFELMIYQTMQKNLKELKGSVVA